MIPSSSSIIDPIAHPLDKKGINLSFQKQVVHALHLGDPLRCVSTASLLHLRHKFAVLTNTPYNSLCLCICSFRQVLFNLLSNACKFTPSKGSVSVRIYNDEEHPQEVVASVSDTGIGIKQENLKLLFAVRY